MNSPLSGKVAVVTGASSGFGEAIARTLHKAGAHLILVARRIEPLQQLASELTSTQQTVIPLAGDVTDHTTFDRIVARALDSFGRLDILVNNAGGGVQIAPLEDQTPDAIDKAISLNMTSVINACQIVGSLMKQQGSGLIINISSACAKFAWPGWSVYSAAKAGLSMFSRCLYTELRPHGVGVTVVVPGGANTGFQSAAGIESFDWQEEESLRPEHIAHAVLAIATMPQGAVVPEMVVYGMSQTIEPF